MARHLGKSVLERSRLARIAALILKHLGLIGQSSADRVVSKDRMQKSVPVYDLTIRHHHCYFANGILVSNSDAFGLVAVARPILLGYDDDDEDDGRSHTRQPDAVTGY